MHFRVATAMRNQESARHGRLAAFQTFFVFHKHFTSPICAYMYINFESEMFSSLSSEYK